MFIMTYKKQEKTSRHLEVVTKNKIKNMIYREKKVHYDLQAKVHRIIMQC
jgi:hypothetical protein